MTLDVKQFDLIEGNKEYYDYLGSKLDLLSLRKDENMDLKISSLPFC